MSGCVLILLGAGTVAALIRVAVGTRRGQQIDEYARYQSTVPADLRDSVLASLQVVSVGLVIVAVLVAVATAVLRHHPAAGIAAVILVAGANVTTQLIKRLLDRPTLASQWDLPNSLPSGHVTVITSLALAGIIVAARGWRRPMLFGASALVTYAGAGVMITRWHRPSDVLAAYAVCAAWTGVVAVLVAVVASLRTVRPPLSGWRRALGYLPVTLLGSAAVGIAFVAAGIGLRGTPQMKLAAALGLALVMVTASLLMAVLAALADRMNWEGHQGKHLAGLG